MCWALDKTFPPSRHRTKQTEGLVIGGILLRRRERKHDICMNELHDVVNLIALTASWTIYHEITHLLQCQTV